jgi:hypothetical protein
MGVRVMIASSTRFQEAEERMVVGLVNLSW